MKTYRTICISLYVEELVALDAKVAALKAAGYRKANRSTVLALAATQIDDETLVALMPKSREQTPRVERVAKPVAASRAWDSNRCGRCGIKGHNTRTCNGVEVEIRVEAIR